MRVKIVLFGKSGMLGSCFCAALKDEELFAYDQSEADITDVAAVEQIIKGVEPDFVVNCAAFTDVDRCESEQEMACLVNGEAAGDIARNCAAVGAKLVHFSTDYVFDGEKAEGYNENDSPSPINAYGESKLRGEKLIRENMKDYFIVRPSWLFGKGGKNFVDTMLSLAEGKKALEVVDDQIGSPTYTKDLCDAVVMDFIKNEPNPGIYHLTNSGICSWHEFAQEIFRIKGLDVTTQKISSDKLNRAAKRPKCSILLNTKLPVLRSWQEALRRYLVRAQLFTVP